MGSLAGRRAVVVGAGAFGGWTALSLLRRGTQVTLVDRWGPANSRASSGGETRILRATYGPREVYVRMAARALTLWKENEALWKRRLFHRTGALWLSAAADDYERAAMSALRANGVEFEQLAPGEAARRFPQIEFEGVPWCIYESEAGYLLARQGCQAVLDGFLSEGGTFRQELAAPERSVSSSRSNRISGVRLSGGDLLQADDYVFASGPWLASMFPELGWPTGEPLVEPTRQELFYFGTPAHDLRFEETHCPVWIDNGERRFYGIPGNEWRGFKLADDSHGARCDPTRSDRTPSTVGIEVARRYMEHRFPGMKGAPLIEARVCQYENTPDADFLVDQHPESSNTWLVGGGSGHGFKHGPAVGELVAAQILGEHAGEPAFRLGRRPS